MSNLSLSQVEHLEKLARLDISPAQKELFAHELSNILDYVDQIKKLKTGRFKIVSTINGLVDVLRSDVDGSVCLSVEEVLKNALATQENYFKVKAIFEND